MDKDTWALKLGKLATEAKERRTAAAAAMNKESNRGETVRQTRARILAEEARLQAAELQQQRATQSSPTLESLPENPSLHEFEHLDSEMAQLQSLISSLQGEKSELLSQNAELVRDVLHLRSQVEGLETTITSLRDELNALRASTQTHGALRKTAAAHVTQQTHRKRSQ
jgi:chromosome segregation ATPase